MSNFKVNMPFNINDWLENNDLSVLKDLFLNENISNLDDILSLNVDELSIKYDIINDDIKLKLINSIKNLSKQYKTFQINFNKINKIDNETNKFLYDKINELISTKNNINNLNENNMDLIPKLKRKNKENCDILSKQVNMFFDDLMNELKKQKDSLLENIRINTNNKEINQFNMLYKNSIKLIDDNIFYFKDKLKDNDIKNDDNINIEGGIPKEIKSKYNEYCKGISYNMDDMHGINNDINMILNSDVKFDINNDVINELKNMDKWIKYSNNNDIKNDDDSLVDMQQRIMDYNGYVLKLTDIINNDDEYRINELKQTGFILKNISNIDIKCSAIIERIDKNNEVIIKYDDIININLKRNELLYININIIAPNIIHNHSYNLYFRIKLNNIECYLCDILQLICNVKRDIQYPIKQQHKINQIIKMGFNKDDVLYALIKYEWNVEHAIGYLINAPELNNNNNDSNNDDNIHDMDIEGNP